MSDRAPAVAGAFYPGDPQELLGMLASFREGEKPGKKLPVKAVLVPHAGFVYSGKVAAKVYGKIDPPSLCILLGPNHTGMGARASLWNKGSWRTPLGSVPIDEEAAAALLSKTRILEPDERAHRREHCLEVQLPFLQAIRKDLRIVPIVLGHLSPAECEALARELADFVKASREPVLLISSSDMNHYLPDRENRAIDKIALKEIEAFSPEGLYETVEQNDISMCGYIPTAIVMRAAKELGAKHSELVAYATSAEAFGDKSRVVGYAGALFW
ncbi:MAG: AmmeMemoRadiSam system protein B [Bdellovibrionota bacterium]